MPCSQAVLGRFGLKCEDANTYKDGINKLVVFQASNPCVAAYLSVNTSQPSNPCNAITSSAPLNDTERKQREKDSRHCWRNALTACRQQLPKDEVDCLLCAMDTNDDPRAFKKQCCTTTAPTREKQSNTPILMWVFLAVVLLLLVAVMVLRKRK